MNYYCTNYREGCSKAGRPVNIPNDNPEKTYYCKECDEPLMDEEQFFEDGENDKYIMGDQRS